MTKIGSYEAKTHFSKLLEKVAEGQEVLITKHGMPVAKLVPVKADVESEIRDAVESLKNLRRGNKLGKDLTIRQMIEEGRRF